MGRFMETVQAWRAGRSHIAPLALVKLTTYTDRTGGVVDKVFYLSDRAVVYDYGNTGTDQVFLPVILGGSEFFSGILHLSQPDDLTAFAQSFDLQCSNAKINGSRLATLLQNYNLEGASIQIAQIFLTKAEMDSRPVDLTAMDGDEHLVLFRGRVNRVAPTTNTHLTIQCTMELPSMAGSWNYANDDTQTDPIDLGKRLPRIYGKAKHAPCINFDVGGVTTMADQLDSSETGSGFKVADGSRFPDGSFQIRVDAETMDCDSASGNTFSIVTRGVNSVEAQHAAGSVVSVVIAKSIYIVSDRPSVALDELFVINPLNGLLNRLTSSTTPWTTNLADTTPIPGQTVTSVSFSAGQITSLLAFFKAQATAEVTLPQVAGSFTQQPINVTGLNVSTHRGNTLDNFGTGDGTPSTAGRIFDGDSGFFEFQVPAGLSITTQTSIVELSEAGSVHTDVRIEVGGVLVGTVSAASIPAFGSNPARFSFADTEIGDIEVNPTGNGTVHVHHCERVINIAGSVTSQVAIAANTNMPINEDDVRDGNTGTGITTTKDEGWVEVEFPDPGFVYHAQRIRIHFDSFGNSEEFALEVNGVRTDFGNVEVNENNPPAGWHTYETQLIGNTIRFRQKTLIAVGVLNEIERDVIRFGSDPGVVSSPSNGWGLRFFADVDGIPSPEQEVTVWETGEDFDDGTWEVSGCTVAVDTGDKVEGTGSQKISIDVDALAGGVVIQTNAVTNWSANANSTVGIVDTEDHREGSDCIVGTSTDDNSEITFDDAATTIDLTDTGGGVGLFVFDFKIQKNGYIGIVRFLFGNDTSNRHFFDFHTSDFAENIWYTLIIDYRDPSATGGAPDMTDVDHFVIAWNSGGDTPAVGSKVFIDNIKVVREVDRVIQNNSAGGVDYSGSGSQYRLSGKRDAGIGSADITAYISDDVGSGTTKTTDFRQIEFPPSWVVGSWTSLVNESFADTNTPDVSNVNTVRIEIAVNLVGIHLRDPILAFRVDDLAYSATLGNPYDAAAGEVMIHPADIMRHWLVEQGGEGFDQTTYDALVISLGAMAEWGFDIRSLGFTWEEILQRMAFEARCNVVAVEASTGRVWKMLAARNDYGFGIPAGSAEITQTHGLSDVGRSVDDIASYFSFRFGFDASLPGGGNEEGFALALLANPSASSVPITAALLLEAAQRFGPRDSDPVAFRCIQDVPTAQDVAGYIVQERMDNRRRVFQLEEVAWFDALPYDVGDLVRIVPPWQDLADDVQLFACDDYVPDFFSADPLANESGTVFEGSASMKLEMPIGDQNIIAGIVAGRMGIRNLTDRAIAFWIFIPTGDLALINFVALRISSTLGGATNWMQFHAFPRGLVENAWQRIEFPISAVAAFGMAGSPDLTKIINLRLSFQTLAPDDGSTFVLFDDVGIVNPSATCRITSMSKAFDRNDWTINAVEVLEAGQRTP